MGLTPLPGDADRDGVSWAWGSPLGREGLEPHVRHPNPGAQHWEDEPVWKPVGLPEGCEKPGRHSEIMCADLLAPAQCGGSKLKPARPSEGLPKPPRPAAHPAGGSCSSISRSSAAPR